MARTGSDLDGLPDLTKPGDFWDISLLVEEKLLYTCRGLLASASPVWMRMFTSDFLEKDAQEVPLPGKKFNDVLEWLMCILPSVQKPVTGGNVMQVLPLADEYQMSKLKQDCEHCLLLLLDRLPQHDLVLSCVNMARKYQLHQLLEKSVNKIADLKLTDIQDLPEYGEIDSNLQVQILEKKVQTLEEAQKKLEQKCETWRKKNEDMEDCLKRMSREKFTVKRVLDETVGAWELKGSDARCIDPVHIYGPRNYSCEKCTRQVHTYIQSKVHFLLNRGSTCSGISWS